MSGEGEFHNHLNLPGPLTVIAPHSFLQTIILEHSHVATAKMSSQFHALHLRKFTSADPKHAFEFNQRKRFSGINSEQLKSTNLFSMMTIRLLSSKVTIRSM